MRRGSEHGLVASCNKGAREHRISEREGPGAISPVSRLHTYLPTSASAFAMQSCHLPPAASFLGGVARERLIVALHPAAATTASANQQVEQVAARQAVPCVRGTLAGNRRAQRAGVGGERGAERMRGEDEGRE